MSFLLSTTFLDIIFACLALFIVLRLIFPARSDLLPPGPARLPFGLGNVLDMPAQQPWQTFADWGDKYGDICSVTVFGQPLIVVNSAKVARDMLDKKSAIYSDRPTLEMGGELVGWKNTLVLLPYGSLFRQYRRLAHRLLGSRNIIREFLPIEEDETRKFLQKVLGKPEELSSHIRKCAGAIILRIAYGYSVSEDDTDPLVKLADLATDQFSLSTAPGAFLVDIIPSLRHLPDWFPGAAFKRTAANWALNLTEMVEQPFRFVKQGMASGSIPASYTSKLLEDKKLTTDDEFAVKWSAASLYSGGADTTVSAMYSFFLAMTLYPEVAKKCQQEIDSVIGSNRLPTFADRPLLPYCDAMTKEVSRWNSVVPTAVPHRVIQDDYHEGYFIPKGSLVIANIWKMTHDPRTYKDPFIFNPDRFLGESPELDPYELCFGFGRRICPGMHLADASVFISCAMSLAVFDISKSVENGVVIEPLNEKTEGTISHPKAFKCTIRPRSPSAISLIQGD